MTQGIRVEAMMQSPMACASEGTVHVLSLIRRNNSKPL